ncbi:hypothetical protein FACS1894184_18300 [Clostridia bacterium]|nr:hypothetical protein FACS1894184_18300 [Clostridia bacterium]
MANTIAPSTQWAPLFDEAYRLASLTAVLDSPPDMTNWTQNGYQLEIPRMTLPGMANYSRSTGYVAGDVNVATQLVTPTYERGRKFVIDKLDVDEAMRDFGVASGQFIRQSYTPELDAFRIAAYSGATGIGSATGTLTTGSAIITALRAAVTTLDNAECPDNDRVRFILPGLHGIVEDMDTTNSRAVLARFAQVTRVPPTRMYKTVTLTPGGGYTGAGALNFLAVSKTAVVQVQKHVAPKIVTPEANQDADAWLFGFRSTGYCAVYQNKLGGVYAHSVAADKAIGGWRVIICG